MQTKAHPVTQIVTRVMGADSTQHLLEIEVSIRQVSGSEPIFHKAVTIASQESHKGAPCIHEFPTSLTDANKVGLDNLAYWSTGRRRSKNYLINQALAHYLALFEGSRHSERLSRSKSSGHN